MLPEKEARTVVAQILSGLVYLNTKPRSVIHYDLKPANILFDRNGECKITVRAAGWDGVGVGSGSCVWGRGRGGAEVCGGGGEGQADECRCREV
jgi:hypothetical protein